MKRIPDGLSLRIRKRKFVKGSLGRKSLGRVLLHFKTDVFALPRLARDFSHVNDWEVLEIIRIANTFGFDVDVLDREIQPREFQPTEKYDVFIGIAAGMSGRYFPQFAELSGAPKKWAFVSSHRPDIYNEALLSRYQNFSTRHSGMLLQPRGLKLGIKTDVLAAVADGFLCEGQSITLDQYSALGKPTFQVFPPSAPFLIDFPRGRQRSSSHVLYFGSHRNILKGLDLVIEAFAQLPHLNLHICTPAVEEDFDDFYRSTLSAHTNIHWHGFVPLLSKKFRSLNELCQFVVLLSAADSTATSVTTCMRLGLIPLVSPESDIPVEDCGFLVTETEPTGIAERINLIVQSPSSDLMALSERSLMASEQYTTESFSRSFAEALTHILA